MKSIILSGHRRNKIAFRATAISSVFILAWFWKGQGVGLCIFHHVTGLQCPGCGMTRAFHSITHGDIVTAFGFNIFAVPLFLIMSAVLLLDVAYLTSGTQFRLHISNKRTNQILWAGLFSVLLYGAIRNLTTLP
jgi:hypothetical protein